ncbi:hypothetical protein FACS189485_15620 [Spirochaetia bacterium]|nr:hypothetical protein FACS189485_15620 [Spirochaetia bacterium]
MAKWWINHPWRQIQTNLRQIDMQDIDADQFVRDLQSFYATSVLFNASGIIANYPTDLDFEPVNDYLHGDSLAKIIEKCHEADIKVIARTDFSKIRAAVYEKHPDWAYRTADGKIVNYNGDVHVCPNGPYQQDAMFKIISDMFARLPFDGIFYNMAGFQTRDYSNNFYGLCHCENCKRKFRERFGLELPVTENLDNPVYQKYRVFVNECTGDLNRRLTEHVRSISTDIAINGQEYQRIESNTEIDRPLPVWQYSASSNTRNIRDPEKGSIAPMNTSVDFLGFPYRHVAVSPWLQELRLWQALANQGGLDYYLIGRLDNHGDKSGYEGVRKVFKFAAEQYEELKDLLPVAQALVFHKELWDDDAEARGWVRALSEWHIPLDEMRLGKFSNLLQLKRYRLIILPDLKYLSDEQISILDQFAEQGGTVLATGESAQYNEKYEPRHKLPLKSLGINEVYYRRKDILSAMFLVGGEDKKNFPHFKDTSYVAIGHELIFTRLNEKAKPWLSFIPPQAFGPPERCYAENKNDLPGFSINQYGQGRGIYVPWKPGAFFYKEGYPNTLWFMQDLVEQICGIRGLAPGLTPMVETTLAARPGRVVVQLVNITGHYGNSYYEPLPVSNITLQAPVTIPVTAVRTLRSGEALPYKQANGVVEFTLPVLKEYEAVILETA